MRAAGAGRARAVAVPWGTIVAVVIGSAVVGVVAALPPALRASRLRDRR
ncbi:hypothetical protein [Streptomyces sp. NPDC004658]